MWLRRTGSYALAATVIVSAGAGAQTSALYLTAGNVRMNSVVQGGSLINSWTQANNALGYGESAIAVSGDVRTLIDGTLGIGLGSQYTLGGAYTGTDYNYPIPGASFFDGATDGSFNYLVEFFTGGVWRVDRNWANPSQLFSAPALEWGITWDASNNTIWTLGYYNGIVTNWSLAGAKLSSFNSGLTVTGALAMDYADGTLWMTSNESPGDFGTLYQYSKSGVALGTVQAARGAPYFGGEFNVTATPEPASIVLLATGLLVVVPIARRRMRRG